MFYIKLIDNNFDKNTAQRFSTVHYFSCTNFQKFSTVFDKKEKEWLDSKISNCNEQIGGVIADGDNYFTQLIIKTENNNIHIIALLNAVDGYVMNEQGQTIDRI